MPLDLVFRPRGPWGDPSFDLPRAGRGAPPRPPADEGPGAKVDKWVKLPEYPTGRVKRFPFYRVLNSQGTLTAWLRAGSPIDQKSGVYFLLDLEADKAYVGSSVGVSKQGNVRRTVNRHFQEWNRSRMYQDADSDNLGGVVLERRDVLACVLLVPLTMPVETEREGRLALAPLVIESWYISEICQNLACYNDIGVGAVTRDDPSVPF